MPGGGYRHASEMPDRYFELVATRCPTAYFAAVSALEEIDGISAPIESERVELDRARLSEQAGLILRQVSATTLPSSEGVRLDSDRSRELRSPISRQSRNCPLCSAMAPLRGHRPPVRIAI
jgi:hypothetical protein